MTRPSNGNLQTTTTATALSSGGISGDGGNILNAANLQTSTSQSTESGLSSRTGGLGAGSSSGAELDVDGSDTDLLAAVGAILGGHHGGIGRRLIAISLNLHSSGDTADGFLAGQIGDVLQIPMKSAQRAK